MTNLEVVLKWDSKRKQNHTLKRVCIKLLNGENNSKVKFLKNLKEISKTYRPLNYRWEAKPHLLQPSHILQGYVCAVVHFSVTEDARVLEDKRWKQGEMSTRFITYFNLHSFICITIFYFCKVKTLPFYSSSSLSQVYHVQVKTLVL